ncbi:putative quinol monooxygenase [Nonomuraea lactucae]|uniref:putative quinol monooxygenase n=1 Tax=Nonomuraea lactucae TaxID=2249762 RepID=UPI0013B43A8B|nr:putative quinol monooxygenase [Nonomuraea lactucae]
MYIIVARTTVRVGTENKARELFLQAVEPSRLEKGNVAFFAHQDPAEPTVFVFYEQWADEESFQRHMAEPHTMALLGALEDLVEDQDMRVVTLL